MLHNFYQWQTIGPFKNYIIQSQGRGGHYGHWCYILTRHSSNIPNFIKMINPMRISAESWMFLITLALNKLDLAFRTYNSASYWHSIIGKIGRYHFSSKSTNLVRASRYSQYFMLYIISLLRCLIQIRTKYYF